MSEKKVLVIGGGIAGLAAADQLSKLDVGVFLVERSNFLGGHGIRFACKATDKCVKCGACMVEEKLKNVIENDGIDILTHSHVLKINKNGRYSIEIETTPEFIDPATCTNCGECAAKCPVEGAVIRGSSVSHTPLYAINPEKCLYIKDQSCRECEKACPESAIQLDTSSPVSQQLEADAVILATGFKAFDPVDKPYGYRRFPNVITNLELEEMLRNKGIPQKPSDGASPEKIAFIQCVGSRDAKLNHLWCSKICCGSALRMANLIKSRKPETEITFFYIDVQTFGKDFEAFYENIKSRIQMIRTIPGDIYPAEEGRLNVNYFDNEARENREALFDMVVLSVGITPQTDQRSMTDALNILVDNNGFLNQATADSGIFIAGATTGPMSIPESIVSAGQATEETIKFLKSL